MKGAGDLIPWKVTDISIRPYEDLWSFNPSIHYDGSTWRCVLRCCDYAMPDGVTIRSAKAGVGHQTKNAMVILDPKTWKPIKVHKMAERDGLSRTSCANVGFEDMRIFRTERGGLQGIAASLHLDRGRPVNGHSPPPEQVLLSFDAEYNIVGARPIRGDRWSGSPQKNWVPFDNCTEPRFLFSIDRGTMFDERGALSEEAAIVRVLGSAPARSTSRPIAEPSRERPRRAEPPAHPDRRTIIRSTSNVGVQVVRGGRLAADALTSRAHSSQRGAIAGRVIGATGRVQPPKYQGLRGGSQLVRVGDDAWLGIAHEMHFVKTKKKWYWHTWYLVNSRGKLISTSEPMKLVENGIEFAAGLAIDGDRAVVSFGVDDMECKIGETRLSAVMEILRPV